MTNANDLKDIFRDIERNFKDLYKRTAQLEAASGVNVSGGSADPDAIHDNIANEINLIADKAVPVSADIVVIEDSAASYAKKKVLISALLSGGPFVLLDGSNQALWVPNPAGDATQDITGNFNLSSSIYEYKIGDAHALSMPWTGNLLAGAGAGGALVVGATRNVILGTNAGGALTTDDDMVIIGWGAGETLPAASSYQSIIIGSYAAQAITADVTASNIIGYLAAYAAVTLIDTSDVIGTMAAQSATSIEQSVVIGYEAAKNAVGVSFSVVLGREAAKGITRLEKGIAIGWGAAETWLDGYENVAIGYQSGVSADGDYNTFIGAYSGGGSEGDYNIAIGYVAEAGDGDYNITIGERAGRSGATGSNNILIGSDAGDAITTGSNIVAIGGQAGTALTSGGDNTLVGYSVGAALTTQTENVIVGYTAAQAADVAYSTIIGANAYSGAGSMSASVFIANDAGGVGAISNSVVMGWGATGTLGVGEGTAGSVIIGYQAAGFSNLDSDSNVLIGYNAGYKISTGGNNTAVGATAAQEITTGTHNTVMGSEAAYYLDTGTYNSAFGYLAGQYLNDAHYCSFFGAYAGEMFRSGGGTAADYNTAFGYKAAQYWDYGQSNVVIGALAGGSVIAGDNTLNRNTVVGAEAGFALDDGADDSVLIGYRAGYSLVSVDGCIFVGNEAGYYETAANKLFIDNAQRASEADARTKALMYGIFNAATANQYLYINANVTITEGLTMDGCGINTTDYISFNLAYAGAIAEGKLQWNADDGTLDLGLPGGDVTLQIGEESVLRAENNQGAQIDNGKVVYISGGTGNFPQIKLADNSSLMTSGAIGVATEDIANSQKGYVTNFGLVRDVNTNGMAAGSLLWLGTSGDYTTTRPTPPTTSSVIGIVIRSHLTEGIIFVSIALVPRLRGLSDVYSPSTPRNGANLSWNDSASRWETDYGLIENINTVAKIANYAILTTDNSIVCDTSGGAFTITLPAAPEDGRVYTIILETSGNVLTVNGNGKNIVGSATVVMSSANDAMQLVYGGAQWHYK